MRVTDEVNSSAGIPRAVISRNTQELPELVEEHEEVVRELEGVLAKYLKNPDKLPARPTMRAPGDYKGPIQGGRVDSIEYLTDRIRTLEIRIKDVRHSIDQRNAMPYGFASWEKIEQAHTVAYSARKKHPQGTTVRLAPQPNDLIWKNLSLDKKARNWKRFVNGLWVTVLTVLWIAPNAMIAIFLTDLNNLGSVWPAFESQLKKNRTIWSIIQGVASPAITTLVYLILPVIFRRLSINAGDMTKTSRERHVVHRLYAFFVFNNLVVFSLFSAVWSFVTAVISNKKGNETAWQAIQAGQFYYKMMSALCTISPFWATYLLQRNLGAAMDLSQLINLVWIWARKTFFSPTPRELIEWTAPQPFHYAEYYNYFLFYTTVALCFSTLQPIVLPITALYFSIDSYLKKYLLLYIFVTKTESGGQFWRIIYNRVIFATILADVIIALVVKAAGTWAMVFTMIPLPFLMLGFKAYCARAFDDACTYYSYGPMKDAETLGASGKLGGKGRSDKVAVRFGNPVLFRPLMTPMVHAKAQDALRELYRGRLSMDGENTGYGDIALDPMSHSRPGKSAGPPSNAPFEVVSESQLDFSYFKNRPEFREEHGGGGNLYGKPDDLISERSNTPRPFDDAASISSSRAGSPIGFGRKPLPSDEPGTIYAPGYQSVSRPGLQGRQYSQGSTYDLATTRSNLYTHPNDSEGGNLLAGAEAPGFSEPDYNMSQFDHGQHPMHQDDPASYEYVRQQYRQ